MTTDLERSQRIPCYRELGFGLDKIAAILDDPDVDPTTSAVSTPPSPARWGWLQAMIHIGQYRSRALILPDRRT